LATDHAAVLLVEEVAAAGVTRPAKTVRNMVGMTIFI
jgi:hypothetical protein